MNKKRIDLRARSHSGRDFCAVKPECRFSKSITRLCSISYHFLGMNFTRAIDHYTSNLDLTLDIRRKPKTRVSIIYYYHSKLEVF